MSSKVRPWLLLLSLVLLAAGAGLTPAAEAEPAPTFDDNYVKDWGNLQLVSQGTEADLTLDQSSGGAGFRSKSLYGSGFFHMRMKVPSGYTAGVVTTFYLTTQPEEDTTRDEMDLEFLGDKDGVPVRPSPSRPTSSSTASPKSSGCTSGSTPPPTSTTTRSSGTPTNSMFVDDTPVRVLRNLSGTVPGYEFPAKPAMVIRASVWDGSAWATDGGRTKVDRSRGPFTAGYQGFDVSGCASGGGTPCDSPDLWWNGGEYRGITDDQRAAYERVRKEHMSYDYCADKDRFPDRVVPIECSYV
ncbi:unnamed protein product [Urochloa decumbens]|uniref:Xyloglucan endotransglucosylase/hydrolase n=1 Tax=Urochloa decumbens TaxID=240449 RepID=A0ABC9DEY5_9POAL